ncbi:hypothetical protein GLU60_01375 [Nanohaloarchaea archaeon H01]|nr:hypothetical protein [Nanohaloarchaea archaeon H01]
MGHSYREAIRHSEHDYGEYLETINFVDAAIESTNSQKIFESTKRLLIEEYESELQGGRKRRRIKQKAKEAAHPRLQGPYNFISEFKGRAGSERLVKEAIEEGYLQNIKLPVPWHPGILNDTQKLTTFPHQHKAAVLYTSRRREELFTKKYLEEIEYHKNIKGAESVNDLYNPKSILKAGFIAPGNKSKDEETRVPTRRRAIYLSGGIYADSWGRNSPIFEFEIPTNNLGFIVNNNAIWSIEDWFEKYDSPNPKIKKNQVIFANKYEEKGYPHLPLKFVNGVQDPLFSETKHFYPLEQYAQRLYEEYPDRVPKPSEWNLQKVDTKALEYTFERQKRGETINFQEVKAEAKWLKKWLKNLEMLERYLDNILTDIKWIKDQGKRKTRFKPRNFSLEEFQEFNVAVSKIESRAEQDQNLEALEPPVAEFRELLSRQYFRNLEKDLKQTEENLQTGLKELHEIAERKEGNPSKILNSCSEMIEELLEELVEFKIDKGLINAIIQLSNVSDESKKKKIREALIKSMESS